VSVSDQPAPSLESGTWILDPARSSVEFRSKTFWGLVTVKGKFTSYEGSLDLTRDPAIELTVDASSLDTGNKKRDTHLRSGDFFNVEETPNLGFRSSSAQLHDDHLHVSGTITAAGRTAVVEPAVHIHAVAGGFEIESVTQVDQRALGMTYSPAKMILSPSTLIVRGQLIPQS
jgi:polyisoprenoid-binding protein YceI